MRVRRDYERASIATPTLCSFPIAGTFEVTRGKEAQPLGAAEFPANREICREIHSFRPTFEKTVQKMPTITGDSSKIPCAAEQGIFVAEQGTQIPCSS
jgi:hypothetical protein